ncbi:MAG TPA: AAA family ATPase, partial [Thermomicrobiales bacterium]|nr:AAA family ATPase [Thermomicrobiales bacterium]
MAEAARRAEKSGPTSRAGSDQTLNRLQMENLTPGQIVAELDRYVIGQNDAKRAVAVALRNRYRRQLLPEELRQEVQPKNILMIGPTGVGKTEIARRVAKIVDAPFLKVEATKFTEVGYVGRDVESIVRDLVEIAISMLHGQRLELVKDEAGKVAAQRLADLLVEQLLDKKPTRNGRRSAAQQPSSEDSAGLQRQEIATRRRLQRERNKLLRLLNEHALDEETVEIEIDADYEYDEYNVGDGLDDFSQEDLHSTFRDFLDGIMPRRTLRRRVSVREAQRILTQQEANRLVDFDAVIDE